jgi:lipoyl(octanoyl) transferase
MKFNVVKLGKIDYNKSLDIQLKLLELCQLGKIDDTLLLVEHPPVLTIGKSGSTSNILFPKDLLESMGISIYNVNRGGNVTYHGPGQIVGYPIINLKHHGIRIKDFVAKIEEVFIQLLGKEYNINAHRDEKYIGVWVEDEKVTAIGIAIKKYVTMHGFAFNVNTNLEHFKLINPCGITEKGVTSLQKLTGQCQNFDLLNDKVIEYFSEIFDMEFKMLNINELIT